MQDLLKHIEEFYSSDIELTKRMKELAKVFLFGGYIGDIKQKVRQGVFKSSSDKRYIPKRGTSDGKFWAFRREIEIELR